MRWKLPLSILSILACLVVIAVLVVYLIVSRVDFNALKPDISKAVKEATGRDLKLKGEITTEIGLMPTLVMNDVSFGNTPWGSRPEMVDIERIEVKVAILPLLRKTIEVRRLVLVGPDVLIETNASGESNLPALIESPPPVLSGPKSIEGKSAAGAKPMVLWVTDLRIERGRLSYLDGVSGRTRVVSLEQFTASAEASDSPVRMTARGAFGDKAFQVEATAGSLQALADPNTTWPLKLRAGAIGTTLTLEGEAEDILHGKRLAANVDIQGKSVPDLAGMAGMSGVPDVGPFKATGRMVMSKSVFGIERFDVEAGGEDRASFKLTGSVKDLKTLRGIDVTFDVHGPDLSKAGQLAGVTLPAKAPFQVSGHIVDTGERTFKISDLKGAFGESDLQGALDVTMKGTRPRIDGSFSSSQMDLRPFLVENKGKDGASTSLKRERVFSTQPFSVPSLTEADAHFQVRVENVLAPRWTVSNLVLDLGLDNGKLSINPFKAALWGGTVDGHLDMQTQGKALTLHPVLKARGIDVGSMTQYLKTAHRIEGSMDLDVDVKGTGASQAEFMAGLDGRTVLAVSRGRLDNGALDLLGGDIGATALRFVNPFSQEAKTVEINCLVSGFGIRNGMADSTALAFDTRRVSVVGDGGINLKTEQLDIAIKPSPKEGFGVGGVGRIGLSAGELARGFRLSGSLMKPSLTIDAGQTALSLGKEIGITALLGPAGLAASMASGDAANESACSAALEAARKGIKYTGTAADGKKNVVDKAARGARGAVEGVGGKLRKMFGK